jgi:hypothetical protein
MPAPNHGLEQSLSAFHSAHKGIHRVQEGTPHFEIHRTNLLMSAERWLLYSVTHYRRALEMLVPSSAPWAQVTLYYSAFFGANCLLAMFGAWVGQTISGTIAVDVEKGAPGQQELKIVRGSNAKSPTGARGSHRIFWDFFYDSVPTISAWVPSNLAAALSPVNGDYAWQISARNEVNYDMFHAWQASKHFFSTFRNARLKTLSGPLQLQLEMTEQLTRLTIHFARELALSAVALADCGFTGDRIQILRRLVKQQVPALLNQSVFAEFAA